MSSEFAVRVEALGKRYRLGSGPRPTYRSLRESMMDSLQRFRRHTHADRARELWALRDLSFELAHGQVLGVIGRNGAGKSTLLKILARITEPTTGGADIDGIVGSLLEVGTGFHPELTGRENIYLNGAILGMSRADIASKFDEIVAFAEIEQFLDTPVKRYSSGMFMRLAFSVAAHLEPDVLLVDEVLAVGDAEFQKKCLGKMSSVARGGRTVLFVSHNMSAVRSLCSTGLVLASGRQVFYGDIAAAVDAYTSHAEGQHSAVWTRPAPSTSSLQFARISLTLRGEQPNLCLEIDAELETRGPHQPAFLAYNILDFGGTSIMQVLPAPSGFINGDRKSHRIVVSTRLPPLIPGPYGVSAWTGSHNLATLDQVQSAVNFTVTSSPTTGRTYPHTPDHGYIVPESEIVEHRDAD